MKVQTCGDTCEGSCEEEQYTKNTMQPGWSGPFLSSLMRTEKHSHLACCSWLSSKNDTFTHILDGTYEIWCEPTIDTRNHRQHHCFWFLTLSWQCILTHSVTQDGLTRTRNTNGGRNRRKCECWVVKGAGQTGVQSECGGTTCSRRLVHFLLFLPSFFKAQEGFIKHWFVVFKEFYFTKKK